MPQKQSGRRLKETSLFFHYTSMGIQMLVTILVFVLAGYYLDKVAGLSFPIFTLLLSLLGVVGSMFIILRKLM
jgi:F0F1-type ATP synthase assembly protein I